MRNTFLSLIFLIFLFGCSTNNGVTTIVPAEPDNLIANSVSTSQINLVWNDRSTNEDGFKIERKTAQGNYVLIGSTGQNINSFSDLGLTSDKDYTYRVYAFNSAGNSLLYSNEATATTQTICTLNSNNLYGTYKITSVKYQYNPQSQIQEQYPLWPVCMQDISYIFYNNNGISTCRISPGVTVCQGPQPYSLPLITLNIASGGNIWSLTGNTIQWYDASGNVLNGTDINYYCTFFRFTEIDSSGATYTYTMTKQ